MGGMGSGKLTTTEPRRRKARALRERGWTLVPIARELRCTPQAVSLLLQESGQGAASPVCCRLCQTVICQPRQGVWTNRPALCLACLARTNTVPFGERLQALRLARGLTQRQLAARVGIAHKTFCSYEQRERS